MRRFLGIAAGLLVQVLFVVASYYNYVFLAGSPPRPGHAALAWDALLAIQFCVVHSVLLWPGVRKRLERIISPAFYGLFFCTAACLTLLLTMTQWQVGDWAIWQLSGVPRLAVQTLYLSCWGTLFFSLCCSGIGYHTGWLPWWYWVTRQPIPRRSFKPRRVHADATSGLPEFFRPGLVYPRHDDRSRDADRFVDGLHLLWQHAERPALIHYVGDAYREYQARVPGYPGMFFGPLGRRKSRGQSIQPTAATIRVRSGGHDSRRGPRSDVKCGLRLGFARWQVAPIVVWSLHRIAGQSFPENCFPLVSASSRCRGIGSGQSIALAGCKRRGM